MKFFRVLFEQTRSSVEDWLPVIWRYYYDFNFENFVVITIAKLEKLEWVLALVLSNVVIAAIEALNRGAQGMSYQEQLLRTGPLILVAQFGLFIGFRDAPSLMLAWAVFTCGNSLVRVLNAQFVVGEPVTLITLLGVLTVMGGGYLVKVGATN